MTILATIVVLGVLIFVHELGHFLAARSVGIRVERFSIGLGPKIFGYRRGDTEYVVSAIPLGGYVKMGGMDDEVMEAIEGAEEDHREPGATGSEGAEPNGSEDAPRRAPRPDDFDAQPVWARAWVISAGVIMNMIFAVFAFTLVAAGWGQPDLDTTRLAQVRTDVLPEGAQPLGQIPSGASIVRVGDREVARWGALEDAIRESPDGTLSIAFSEPTGEVALSLEGAEAKEQVIAALEVWTEPVVRAVSPGAPADRAGLREGDRIVAVDGRIIEAWPQLVEAVQRSPGREIELTLERAGGAVVRRVTPSVEQQIDPATGEARTIGQIGILGATPDITYTPMPALAAVRSGWNDTVTITREILRFLRDLVTGRMSARNLGSIVTIGEMSGQAAAEGLPVFLQFMALFSVNLAILNMLPIPVLDGGHLLFLTIEAVRRRPLSIRQRMRWSKVGFAVLIGIMVLALGNDFLRLFGR